MTPIHTKKIITLKSHLKSILINLKIFSLSLFILKNNHVKKAYSQNPHPNHIHKPLFLLKITFKSSSSHKKSSNTNNSQSLTNKHKVKYINNACIPIVIIKNLFLKYEKKIFCSVNIRMINLSFDELRLIAQVRNINGYENESKEDLIKLLSETKPETPKLETPKPETPKLISSKLKISKLKTTKPKPRPEIRVNKKK